jgi:N-acetylmuramoyl-L-alanine amidase
MARVGRMTALAAVALIGAPLAISFAAEPNAPVAVAARFSQDGREAKLVFDLSRVVDATASALTSPDRVVVDMPEVNFQLDPSVGRPRTPPGDALVKGFRFGSLSSGKSRIVIDLARTACPVQVSAKPIVDGQPAARLTIELKSCDPSAFGALARAAANLPEPERSAPPSLPVIVLDPGHGGMDGGARGLGGVQEKALVLLFATELKRQLDATKRYATIMTREGDQYVDLDDRVALARKVNASLFVSVHADTLSDDASVSGSTVYTVADHASDVEAAHLAARENAADRRSGVASSTDNPEVTDILFDLKRRETRTYAHIFSRGLVAKLKATTRLNHNPERSAGFVVLKAPEFPSVLVELGYLSNPEDVKSLSSSEWRAKIASAMVREIETFFAGGEISENGASAERGVVSSAVRTDASGGR